MIVTIESLAAGGDGVARPNDEPVVFVPRTAVGDVAQIEITERKKSFARARVIAIKTPGPGRREPSCELFASASCGGCQWLHIDEQAQRVAKRNIVASALRKVCSIEHIDETVVASPATAWRTRARFHWVRPRATERAIVGFVAPRSNRITPPLGCVQVDPRIIELLGVIEAELGPHLHKRGEIDVNLGADGRAVVAVHGPHGRRGLDALVKSGAVAGVVGRAEFGDTVIEFDAGVPITAGGFAQASVAGNRVLVQVVDKALATLPKPKVALELFAGNGNLTRVIAKRAGRVIATEREAVAHFEADNIEWFQRDASAAVLQCKPDPDLIVLDPPRAGASECLGPIVDSTARQVVYVSCDPATLGRDLEKLTGAFELVRVTPVDLMPQTSHIETVCVLSR